MPECHKCPHNEACLKCAGPSDTPHNDGQTFVNIDSIQVAGQIAAMPDDDRGQVVEVMRVWLRLPPTTRDALALRITNPEVSDAEIGRMIGVSRAGVGIAVKRSGVVIGHRDDQLTIGL
jgi:hypothetical protein